MTLGELDIKIEEQKKINATVSMEFDKLCKENELYESRKNIRKIGQVMYFLCVVFIVAFLFYNPVRSLVVSSLKLDIKQINYIAGASFWKIRGITVAFCFIAALFLQIGHKLEEAVVTLFVSLLLSIGVLITPYLSLLVLIIIPFIVSNFHKELIKEIEVTTQKKGKLYRELQELNNLYDELIEIGEKKEDFYNLAIKENDIELMTKLASFLGYAPAQKWLGTTVFNAGNCSIDNPTEFAKQTQAIIDKQLGIDRSSAPDGAFVPHIDVSDM